MIESIEELRVVIMKHGYLFSAKGSPLRIIFVLGELLRHTDRMYTPRRDLEKLQGEFNLLCCRASPKIALKIGDEGDPTEVYSALSELFANLFKNPAVTTACATSGDGADAIFRAACTISKVFISKAWNFTASIRQCDVCHAADVPFESALNAVTIPFSGLHGRTNHAVSTSDRLQTN